MRCTRNSLPAACLSYWVATIRWLSVHQAPWPAIAGTSARSCASCGSTRTPISNTAALTPSGNLHGMPVASLCGHGPRELVELAGFVPALNPKDIRQIGIRSVDAGEKRLVHEAGIEVFDMRFIDETGMRHTMELALALIGPDTHLHVSLDVDFLDPGHRSGGRYHGARRADVSRGTTVYGDDCRHRAAGLA